MQIVEHSAGDVGILMQRIRAENNAKQRDRYRAIAMAIDGMQTKQIMKKLDRSKNFVQRWNYFYRNGGMEQNRTRSIPLNMQHWMDCKARILIRKRIIYKCSFRFTRKKKVHRKTGTPLNTKYSVSFLFVSKSCLCCRKTSDRHTER